MIKNCKTIAEYAICKWMMAEGFIMNYFKIEMKGNTGIIKDVDGNTLVAVYDPETKSVRVSD